MVSLLIEYLFVVIRKLNIYSIISYYITYYIVYMYVTFLMKSLFLSYWLKIIHFELQYPAYPVTS